jgi:hypothetical protein
VRDVSGSTLSSNTAFLIGRRLTDDSNIPCHYSYPARIGKPKGCKNKKTIEKLNALAQLAKQSTAEESKGDNTRSSNIGSTSVGNNLSEHSSKDSLVDTSLSCGAPSTVSNSAEDAQLSEDVGTGFDTSMFMEFPDVMGSLDPVSLEKPREVADTFGDSVS